MDGKRRAFERICREHMRALYGYISLKADRSDAEDILQETMLSAWQSYDGFDERSSVKTWLFTIARRRICDHYRSRRELVGLCSLDEAFMTDDSDERGESVEPGEDFTQAAVGRLDTESALAVLNAVERELVELVFRFGFDYPQCAELLGAPLGTIKSRMSSIRAKLKRRLGEGYDEL